MSGKPEGYQEVAERIHAFYQRHPEGSIRTEAVEFVQVGGKDFVLVKAAVYRTPDDKVPGTGTAMEPIPGSTPFTRGSEVENGETSAWGRALASLGLGGRKIATADELAAKRGLKSTGTQAKFTPKPSRLDQIRDEAKESGLDADAIVGILGKFITDEEPGDTAAARRLWIARSVERLDDVSWQSVVKQVRG